MANQTKLFLTDQSTNVLSGTWRIRGGKTKFTFYIEAESVTVGAHVKVQTRAADLSLAGANWVDIPDSDITITANGGRIIQVEGAFSFLRVSLHTLTDGLYTICAEAA